MPYSQTSLILMFLLSLLIAPAEVFAQPKALSRFERSGKVHSIKSGKIIVQHQKGVRESYKIQDEDEEALSLDGGKFIYRFPATINVAGKLPANLAERGMFVTFRTRLNRFGKQESPVDSLRVLPNDIDKLAVRFDKEPEGSEFQDCRTVARLVRFANGKLILEVPKSPLARQGRLTIKLTDDATMEIEANDLNRVRKGDRINSIKGLKLSTGDYVVREIDVSLTAKRKVATPSFHEQLEQKFGHLSDAPTSRREAFSEHFILHTDISERSSSILLAKLELMHELIGKYYGQRPQEPIECFVVSDPGKWRSKLPAVGIFKIAEGAGVTATERRGNFVKSTVYACEKHSVVQHEAVHAFCSQTFGSSGPVWYAEGMAEMGQYWKPDQREVNIDPVVIEYLANAKPKSLSEIVQANEITGDSWRAYAWRWALCHLLASNPNYSRRFRQLGVEMMLQKPDSFEKAFGKVADQISFEYDQFVETLGNGYRVDLCVWDWNTTGEVIDENGRVTSEVKAKSGWQASQLQVQAGVSYDYVVQGEWQVSEEGPPLNADGDEDDSGRLIGIVFSDYKLVSPLVLGQKGSFTPAVDGQLFLRCDDQWTELADNEGKLTAHFRRSPK